MTLSVDLFWSFRSPYSYLALPKAMRLVALYDFSINARPVYPLAVRDPTFFKRTDPRFARYVVLDSWRVAQSEGIPFRFPRPDPIVQNMQTLEVATEQPFISRLTRLGAAAQLHGRGLAFIREVSSVLYDGSVDNWHQGDHLAKAAARAGLDLAVLEAEIAADIEKFDETIRGNERDHAASGHWGVPTFVFKGEPFFGQDRLDLLIWRLKQNGLTERATG
ncbi:MAG: 2-hydroxychromene-2-carboxylate isomerase [Rhodopseudomonas sp.]|uniref:2-hydroxychromene-2-carboxylate isomerase n=1 Tax=Rhodopseudomonas sp. TaxID=1078 RepID=UPI001836EBF4|nr:2-hydroxychromene-2-carboxylate isomerase [Rhodopseudomonas sp.]NVN85222.1 2-hydroxychromene-2-carboxylate isomerase [Rhodopseudomonas sp.]